MASLLSTLAKSRSICLRNRLSALYSTSSTPIRRPAKSILDDDSTPVDLSEDNEAVHGTRPGTAPIHMRSPSQKSTPTEWRAHREAIKKQFPDGWQPPRKISREAMHGLRQLHKLEPETFTTEILAEKFRISPEAVRRILKSKWEPPTERREQLVAREKAAREEASKLRKLREINDARSYLPEDRKEDRPKRDRLSLV
ncbi:hypothetical protein BKA70DRAFT_4873 [Coprinopsis sp. MPI-PUGE-AT-0042]|nr:hypothetical protein BKA70DRAFT_4873 [Coprinopsis sp. MPI-PUGE-AT-0042]